jgi:hypothetical protein
MLGFILITAVSSSHLSTFQQNPLWIIAFDKLWVSSLSSDGRLLLDEFDLQSRNLGQWC